VVSAQALPRRSCPARRFGDARGGEESPFEEGGAFTARQISSRVRALPTTSTEAEITAAALRVPQIAALVDAAKAYAFANDCYDEESEIAMKAWRSARNKMNEALAALEPKP
jgi:hypothetical protein